MLLLVLVVLVFLSNRTNHIIIRATIIVLKNIYDIS